MSVADMTLRYPVSLPGGKVLLAAGTPLSGTVLREISSGGGGMRHPGRSLLRHGAVRRDLSALVRRGAYRTIFGDAGECAGVFRMMERTLLPRPVLSALDYFRAKEPYTYDHSLRVFALSCLLMRRLREGSRRGLEEFTAGPLHDLGKVCVPLDILRKSSPLRRSERDILEHHTLAGYALLACCLGDPDLPAAAVARDHHERKDRSGYPRGIRLRDRLSHVIAACDVYDALITPRPYRKEPYDNRTALEEITGMAERGKIGWGIVRALVAYNRKDRPPARSCKVSIEKRGTPPDGNLYGIIVEDVGLPAAPG
jgi:HD-GYP domain-containing protein (c-di-GMP phosphodiesterase class II)